MPYSRRDSCVTCSSRQVEMSSGQNRRSKSQAVYMHRTGRRGESLMNLFLTPRKTLLNLASHSGISTQIQPGFCRSALNSGQ